MRVIGGEKGGLRLSDFKGDWIRPTSDKVKGAIFSSLDTLMPGYNCFVDLFAGTGGMGIEALSRGAEEVYLFDKDRRSIKVIRENLKKTGYEQKAKLSLMPAQRGVEELAGKNVKADVIFMDPPYRMVPEMLSLFDQIDEKEILSPDGILVLEHDKSDIISDTVGRFEKIREKTYGNTVISVFRRGE